jgi:hypothetical protein
MMEAKEINDGGAAFPVVHPDGMGVQFFGLSMRDYFAAKAMQSMISKYGFISDEINFAAEQSYVTADAMLEARAK